MTACCDAAGTNSQVDISAAGLAPLRKWLLAPGIAEAFRAPLQQLLEQCLSLSAAMAAAVPSSSSKVVEASSSSTASSRLSGEQLERAKQFYE